MTQFAVILAAAGSSSRFGDPFKKKVYASLANKPMWLHAAEVFSKRRDVGQVILVIAADDRDHFNDKFAGNVALLGIEVTVGGSQRADSVLNGLKHVREELPFVAIHDAARPCLADAWIDAVFAAAQKTGAAILATPCHSTLKRSDANQLIRETVSRQGIWLAQTPQVFRREILLNAYSQHPNPSAATDDAEIVEAAEYPVQLVEGSPLNIKVTTKADLKFAELAMKSLPKPNPFPFA